MIKYFFLQTACFFLLLPVSDSVAAWTVSLAEHPTLPEKIIAVDKDTQEFFVYTQQSPLSLINTFACTTGQQKGDKVKEGDERTPEGVYFLSPRLTRSLPDDLYGNLAYPLNFPNPVDRIRQKTGSGIWLHGRGKELLPRDTRGCVALKTAHLQSLKDYLTPGLPVVIGHKHTPAGKTLEKSAQTQLVSAVAGRVQAWARAWENKSPEFFDFYDAQKFSLAQNQSFAAFKTRKEHLFASHPWVRVMTDNIRVLGGPGYWVSWFRQYYRTPVLVTEGIKRLYWQQDEKGTLRIVGREWHQTPRTLDNAYLQQARSELDPLIEAWRLSWEGAALDAYMAHYHVDAVQDSRRGAVTIAAQKKQVWEKNSPASLQFFQFDYTLVPEGVRVTFRQQYKARNGYSDNGTKIVLFSPGSGGWKIVRETWRPL